MLEPKDSRDCTKHSCVLERREPTILTGAPMRSPRSHQPSHCCRSFHVKHRRSAAIPGSYQSPRSFADTSEPNSPQTIRARRCGRPHSNGYFRVKSEPNGSQTHIIARVEGRWFPSPATQEVRASNLRQQFTARHNPRTRTYKVPSRMNPSQEQCNIHARPGDS